MKWTFYFDKHSYMNVTGWLERINVNSSFDLLYPSCWKFDKGPSKLDSVKVGNNTPTGNETPFRPTDWFVEGWTCFSFFMFFFKNCNIVLMILILTCKQAFYKLQNYINQLKLIVLNIILNNNESSLTSTTVLYILKTHRL